MIIRTCLSADTFVCNTSLNIPVFEDVDVVAVVVLYNPGTVD